MKNNGSNSTSSVATSMYTNSIDNSLNPPPLGTRASTSNENTNNYAHSRRNHNNSNMIVKRNQSSSVSGVSGFNNDRSRLSGTNTSTNNFDSDDKGKVFELCDSDISDRLNRLSIGSTIYYIINGNEYVAKKKITCHGYTNGFINKNI